MFAMWTFNGISSNEHTSSNYDPFEFNTNWLKTILLTKKLKYIFFFFNLTILFSHNNVSFDWYYFFFLLDQVFDKLHNMT